ncbi:MAG TPA: hypothetical protein VHE99_08315 [Gammaproteobacteria bacterium]|nr:hypothetical protein [Gammaproteobacteria bacterium]
MKKIILHGFFFLFIFVPTVFANDPSSWNNLLNALEKNNAIARKYLEPDILKYYDKKYSSYKIYSYCQGNFTNFNSNEYLICTINKDGHSIYLLALGNKHINRVYKFSSSQITKLIYANQEANFSNDPIIECKSSKYMQLIHQVTTGVMGFHWHHTTTFNQFDSFCISNTNSENDKYGYNCYTYNPKNRKFSITLESFTENIP